MLNVFKVEGDVVRISLRNKRGVVRTALIDLEDLPKVNYGSWMLHMQNTKFNHDNPDKASYYARNSTDKKLLHVVILPGEGVVDHINGNGLDNRKSNIARVTQGANSRNRTKLSTKNKSGVPGVYWCTRDNRWIVNVVVDYKRVYLGRYKDLTVAAEVRRKAEEQYYRR